MAAYVVGILHNLERHQHIVQYLQQIDATLEPFGGRFLVHGPEPEVREGEFDAKLIVIEFPDLDQVRTWYESPAYQAIIPLRANHSDSVVFFVQGVPSGYLASSLTKPGGPFDPVEIPPE